jgi:hypothetical protein
VPDLLDVDHRDLHRQPGGVATDERAADHQHAALMDDAGLGGGAAHVEGDRVREPDAVAQRLGADDAGRRTRLQHLDAGAARLVGTEQAAGRLHDQKLAAEARRLEVLAHLAEIAPHPRPHIGVGGRRRGALELAVFLRQLVRGGDEQLRMALLDDRLHPLLVRRIAVGVQEQDGDRLHALGDRVGDGGAHLVFIELDQHLALGIDALADLVAQIAVDQRLVAAEEQIVIPAG